MEQRSCGNTGNLQIVELESVEKESQNGDTLVERSVSSCNLRKVHNRKGRILKIVMLTTVLIVLSVSVIALLAYMESLSSDLQQLKHRLAAMEHQYLQADNTNHSILDLQSQFIDQQIQMDDLKTLVQELNHSTLMARNCYEERQTCRMQPMSDIRYTRKCYTNEVDAVIQGYYTAEMRCEVLANLEYIIYIGQITLFQERARCECSVVNFVTDDFTSNVHGPVDRQLDATCIMIVRRCPI